MQEMVIAKAHDDNIHAAEECELNITGASHQVCTRVWINNDAENTIHDHHHEEFHPEEFHPEAVETNQFATADHQPMPDVQYEQQEETHEAVVTTPVHAQVSDVNFAQESESTW